MAAPRIVQQVAFGSQPLDASYSWTTIGDTDDIGSSYVGGWSYRRGRQNEANRVETGGADLDLGDDASAFDPRNPASPFYPDVRLRVPVRQYAVTVVGAVTYPMFLGYADSLPRTRRIADAWTERTLGAVDGFAILAAAGLAGQSYAEEAAGTRWGNVLDDVGWPAALRDLDAGQSTVAAATFADNDATKALEHLLAVVETENGIGFMNADGEAALIQRHSLITSPYTVSQAVFMDDGGSDPDGWRAVEIIPDLDLSNLANEWAGTRDGGTTQTAIDADSQDQYAPSSRQFTSLATTDAEVLAQAQWKLRQFAEPLDRIARMSVLPGDDEAAWDALLSLDLGSRITLLETPPGFAAEQDADYLIQRLDVRLPAGRPITQTIFTFELWPSDIQAWMILDDATAGQLDSIYALAY